MAFAVRAMTGRFWWEFISDKIVFGHFCEGCRKIDRRESEGGRGFRI